MTRAKTLSGIVIDQQRKLMEPTKKVRDVLANGGDWIDVRGHRKHIKGYLKEFLFAPELADAPIGSLSGGERSRLLLAREFARRGESARARRADQRSRPRDARPAAGSDRRL